MSQRRDGGRRGDRRDRGQRTIPVCGLHACLAVLGRRPEALQRVYHAPWRRAELGPLLSACAARRLPYNEVSNEELERLAKSTHHGGVVAFVEPQPGLDLDALLAALPREAVLLAADGVGNPHNLGAILRTAAWFGAAALVVPQDKGQAGLSAAAMRVAEGGAEHVPIVEVPDLGAALRRLAAAGVTCLAAEAGGGPSPLAADLPRPLLLLLGNEEEGVRPALRTACQGTLSIPGTGAVESLNVSVAAGILLAAAMRQGPAAPLDLTKLRSGYGAPRQRQRPPLDGRREGGHSRGL